MQLATFLSTAAVVATVSARTAISLNKDCDFDKPHTRVINRCPYPVNIWSVLKGDGCPTTEMVTLKKGEIYAENYAYASNTTGRGVSIKISKTKECKGNDITQLEYFLDDVNKDEKFRMNYLDVSYVDCQSDCPTKSEGYYLTAGSAMQKASKATVDNSWCPVLACSNEADCAKLSYILPDDIATKTCDLQSNMDFYMCGGHAPSDDEEDEEPAYLAPAPSAAPSSEEVPTPKPTTTVEPTTTSEPEVSSVAEYHVNAAAVTEAANIDDAIPEHKVKTKVVYVTAYEYVHEKRDHAHRHGRRHHAFRA